ncbi:acyltransferase family protein [Herbaspirillum lusitanum]|uniref:Acyltransferase family protein n=1 Tax=Herbaspirillum lusitanum TaxID=213312 RepID=A0ABW9A6U7_9BURK
MTRQSNPPIHLQYRPDIDGLRAVAVLSVVIFHAFPEMLRGGFVGVDVFFVISGYLISAIIFESSSKGHFSFREFYIRRIRRIFPALILVMSASLLLGWYVLLSDEYKQLGKHIAAGASFISNWILFAETGYFDNSADTKPLLHLWSLGIEEQFYIIWPILVWLLWKRRALFLAAAVSVLLLSFALNVRAVSLNPVEAFYLPHTRFWELLGGGLLAYLSRNQSSSSLASRIRQYGWVPPITEPSIRNICSLFGAVLLAYGFEHINKELPFPGKWAALPVLATILLIYAGPNAWFNRTVLSNRLAVWIGSISFPLYLWHWPLLSFARIIESKTPEPAVRLFLVAAAVFLAWLTYRLIERPIRFKSSGTWTAAACAILITMIGCAGYVTYQNEGWPYRTSIRDYANNRNELIRTAEIDKQCLEYAGATGPLLPYCRFSNMRSASTFAIVGDSHAHVAFPGIAEHLQLRHINSVLLANSSCPPLLGVPIYGQTESEKLDCARRIRELIDLVIAKKDIQKIFLIMRGPIYFTGTEPLTGPLDVLHGRAVSVETYMEGLQQTIDELSRHNKQVFLLLENPELEHPPELCLPRPLRWDTKNCALEKSAVMLRQQSYITWARNLKNVTLIESLDTFCPNSECRIFDSKGTLMYADDDHLSVAGSRFQVTNLLSKYLDN